MMIFAAPKQKQPHQSLRTTRYHSDKDQILKALPL